MKKALSILLFITTLLNTPALFAWGNRAGDLTLSAGGGYYYFDSKREIENHGLPFAIVGFDFTDQFSMEVMWAGLITRFKNVVHDEREINTTLFSLDAVYRFGDWCRLEPYILGGFGMLGLSHNQFDANNEGNLNLGLGAQYFISETLAFRADVRDLYTITGGKNDLMWNLGMTLLFNLC